MGDADTEAWKVSVVDQRVVLVDYCGDLNTAVGTAWGGDEGRKSAALRWLGHVSSHETVTNS